ncbi:MAG: response regulator transcription factor [Actinomyces sp.]|jgi:DNA-binding NarL/FixJ family response regulator|nr:response regulator transcription factor [Actinomyces sp.]MCI1788213.1 response regulator transcription factor [Actinomyces sp.]MCI1830056.1 response regulator transcription factor [Actinomyces sp.]MCI1866495.1 response regulator transcription factor [Actinomyces sp.]
MNDDPVRVLLADDDPLLRTSMSRLLQRCPDIDLVAAVADGAQALHALADHPVDVALLDADMPVLDGAAATARIRTAHPQVRVVILTAFKHDDFLPRAMAAGAIGFLTKDTPIEDLIALIHRAHAGETVLSPRPTAMVLDSYRTHATQRESEAHFLAAVDTLPPHLRDVLALLADATPTPTIATRLHLSEATARTYIKQVLHHTNCTTRTELVVHAARVDLDAE